MNNNFPRILTLLRKEKGLSQKEAATQLEVSQALLSHYEKGIRECGLDFVVKVADFYNVSCDYLLGRTPHRTGAKLSAEDIPDTPRGGTLPKKLLSNSLQILFGILQKCENRFLTEEISVYLMLSVYKMFRLLYSANPKNPQGMFAAPEKLAGGLSAAAQNIAEATARCLCTGEDVGEKKAISKTAVPVLSPEIISSEYPALSASLLNLVQGAETRMALMQRNG